MVHPSRFILMEYSARLFILQNVPPCRQRRASPLIISLSFIVPSGEWSPAEECAFRFEETFLESTFSLFFRLYVTPSRTFALCVPRREMLRECSDCFAKKRRRKWRTTYVVFESCRKFDSLVSCFDIFFIFLFLLSFQWEPGPGSILVLIYVEMRIFICSIRNYKHKSSNGDVNA